MNTSGRSFNQTSRASTSTQVSVLSLSTFNHLDVLLTQLPLVQPYDSPSGTQKFVIGKIDGN